MAQNQFASLDAPAEALADQVRLPFIWNGRTCPERRRCPRLRSRRAPLSRRRPHAGEAARISSRRWPIRGIARVAAARIGVSRAGGQPRSGAAPTRAPSISPARRRGGSAPAACIRLAWERAVEGTDQAAIIYHGELKSEERVYDNRLLIYLLGKTEHLRRAVARGASRPPANWEALDGRGRARPAAASPEPGRRVQGRRGVGGARIGLLDRLPAAGRLRRRGGRRARRIWLQARAEPRPSRR